MGTNYYLYEDLEPCSKCGLSPADVLPRVHIGKSSAGWCFGLRVYPKVDEEDATLPTNLEEWIEYWQKPGRQIRNEYNEYVPLLEMLATITDRAWKEREKIPRGYNSIDSFLKLNDAALGPNNLWRHRVATGWCLGPGPDDATYDLMIGTFS